MGCLPFLIELVELTRDWVLVGSDGLEPVLARAPARPRTDPNLLPANQPATQSISHNPQARISPDGEFITSRRADQAAQLSQEC